MRVSSQRNRSRSTSFTRRPRIFISGGAGGVGTFAIQVAKHLGATVATTASTHGRSLVTRLGADVIVDYTSEDFTKVIRDYDGAFDLIGGETLNRTFSVIRRGGTNASKSSSTKSFRSQISVRPSTTSSADTPKARSSSRCSRARSLRGRRGADWCSRKR
jgi:NADPH:quinone reductase-like Zn-dependent oxidoreductase